MFSLPSAPQHECTRHSSLLDSDLSEQVDRSGSTSAKGTNDQHLDVVHAALDALEPISDMLDHSRLVGVRLQSRKLSLSARLLLRSVGERTSRGTSESSVEAECSDSATGLRVLEELEIVQRSLALRKSSEHVRPAGLLLVAVGELDVGVGERVTVIS